MLPYRFGLVMFRLDRRILFSIFHPVGFRRRRCEFESRLFRGCFVSARTDHPALMCHSFGCQLLPAFLHHLHRLHLRFPTLLSSYL